MGGGRGTYRLEEIYEFPISSKKSIISLCEAKKLQSSPWSRWGGSANPQLMLNNEISLPNGKKCCSRERCFLLDNGSGLDLLIRKK